MGYSPSKFFEMKATLITILSLCIGIVVLQSQQVRIVNMMPNAQSNETNQDSEPNLAINPANPNQMVGSAFTPNLVGSTNAPIYVSVNGGQTWLLNSIVPSQSATTGTGDITNRFGTTSNWLYTGILRHPTAAGASRTMDILRTNNFLGATAMQQLSTRNSPDQPYVQAATVQSGAGLGSDRVYVGNNDLGAAGGQTAAIDQTMAGQVSIPAFNNLVIENRTTASQDLPPIRVAIHPGGIIYGVYERATTITSVGANVWNIVSDLIIVRDDNWGLGANPYTALNDPVDLIAGNRARTGLTYTFATTSGIVGQERGGTRLNIAVDPNNCNRVYIVWTDNNPLGGNNYSLHIISSTNGGVNWSANDLRRIDNAINPALAINCLGELAFSYQRLVSGNWQTIVERTTNDFATTATTTLNTFPDGTPASTFLPYLGDYACLTAMPSGKDFCGVFSASNNPNPANFPAVQPLWQRNVNTATNQLRNLTNTSNVNVSIDPFFYRISPLNIDQDFYVRDWTNSSSSHDQGEEPSDINYWFQFNSDVWTRRNNTAGTFTSADRPANQNPQPVGMGHNYAYARVHRKATGLAETVNLLFLKSEFGTGSNFQLINGVSSFSSLNFGPTDLALTMTSGVQWDLVDPNAVTADHPCMAVEIATLDDPSGNPTLLGRAPGWSNGTDLLVISDNNKAQRNLHVYNGGPGGEAASILSYAIIHNPSFYTRDIRILVSPQKGADVLKPKVSVRAGKGQGKNIMRGDTLILIGMKPCENRWLELSLSRPDEGMKSPQTVIFREMVGTLAVNGFTIGVQSGSSTEFAKQNLEHHELAFDLLARRYNLEKASEQARRALELLQSIRSESDYRVFLDKNGVSSAKLITEWLRGTGGDPFELATTADDFITGINGGNWSKTQITHANLSRKLLAYLSYLDKQNGDVADILQTIRWQRDLMLRSPVFKGAQNVQKSISNADRFIEDYGKVKRTNKDYPDFVKANLDGWREIVRQYFPNETFDPFFKDLNSNLDNPQLLQKMQCQFVSKLSLLVGL
ncbi:MAG: hypothetical protein KBF37_12230 [Saprospiraceae bacterium]|nr:hypothetical protein [Saprospiraceae bacterium]